MMKCMWDRAFVVSMPEVRLKVFRENLSNRQLPSGHTSWSGPKHHKGCQAAQGAAHSSAGNVEPGLGVLSTKSVQGVSATNCLTFRELCPTELRSKVGVCNMSLAQSS